MHFEHQDVPFYRLAVRQAVLSCESMCVVPTLWTCDDPCQAETLYGVGPSTRSIRWLFCDGGFCAAKVVAANPVFFKWSDDPQAEVRAWWHLKHIKEESKQEYS